MTDLAQYQNLVTQKLADSNLGFFTTGFRTDAINEAILYLADRYDIPELRVKPQPTGLITFTNGETSIPSDMLRVIKLWDPIIQSNEYTYLINDLFDDQAGNSANFFWTIDYDPALNSQMMFIKPNNIVSVSLYLRYMKNPVTMVGPNDSAGISFHWDSAVAYRAAAILLNNARNPSAGEMNTQATMQAEQAEQAVRKIGGVKQGERLRSRFEKYPLLNAPQV